MNQITFRWLRCRDHYEVTKDKGGFRVVQPRSQNMEIIEPLELNNALWKQLADAQGNETRLLDFANAFGMLAPFALPLDAFDLEAGEFPNHRPEAIADWRKTTSELSHVIERWRVGDLTEVCRTITGLRLSNLSLRLEPQSWREPPVLSIGPGSLCDAIWVQLAHAVSNDLKQKPCVVCGTWFSYGPGTEFNSKRKYCSDTCKNRFHEVRRRK